MSEVVHTVFESVTCEDGPSLVKMLSEPALVFRHWDGDKISYTAVFKDPEFPIRKARVVFETVEEGTRFEEFLADETLEDDAVIRVESMMPPMFRGA